MQKGIEQKEPYAVTVSDWICILQDKKTANTTLYLFLTSIIIGMIIGLSPTLKEYTGSYIATGIVLAMVLFLYALYKLIDKWHERKNKLIIELYEKVILGDITEPKKIRDEYKRIPGIEKQ